MSAGHEYSPAQNPTPKRTRRTAIEKYCATMESNSEEMESLTCAVLHVWVLRRMERLKSN
jgi:hypothetical protein